MLFSVWQSKTLTQATAAILAGKASNLQPFCTKPQICNLFVFSTNANIVYPVKPVEQFCKVNRTNFFNILNEQ